jgi:hypothetical protein
VVSIVLYTLILVALLNTVSPLRRAAPGSELARLSLSLRQRLMRQRLTLGMLGVALLISAWAEWVAVGGQMLVLLGMVALVAAPVRYRFTTTGFDVNGGRTYAWRDFDGYWVSGWRLRLYGFSQVDLWLTSDQQRQVLAILPQRLHKHRADPRRVKTAPSPISDL